jgi:5-methylcytosine-specific restriction endonuclease McrA
VKRPDASMDHLVPLSKGGDHSWANVALAHRSCNSKRGAGRLSAQLRLVG